MEKLESDLVLSLLAFLNELCICFARKALFQFYILGLLNHAFRALNKTLPRSKIKKKKLQDRLILPAQSAL